jgi:hypothetical protein
MGAVGEAAAGWSAMQCGALLQCTLAHAAGAVFLIAVRACKGREYTIARPAHGAAASYNGTQPARGQTGRRRSTGRHCPECSPLSLAPASPPNTGRGEAACPASSSRTGLALFGTIRSKYLSSMSPLPFLPIANDIVTCNPINPLPPLFSGS